MTIDETGVAVVDLGPARDADPLPSADATSDGARGVLEGGVLVAIGLGILAVESVARGVTAALGEHEPSDTDAGEAEEEEDENEAAGPDGAETLAVIAGASLNLALEAARFVTRMSVELDRAIRPLSRVASIPPVDRAARRLEGSARRMNAAWRDERMESQRAAESFADALVPHLVDAVVDRLDLTDLVLERVDLDRVVESVAIDRLIEGIDLDKVIARVDVAKVIERVDLDNVIARVDIDSVAARIDVERIVDRLDIVAIARGVIDELDLTEIIRASTETMAAETRDGVRVQGMRADRFVSRLVDRALLRQDGVSAPSSKANGSTEDPP